VNILEDTIRNIQTLKMCLQAYRDGYWTPGGIPIMDSERTTLETTINNLITTIKNAVQSIV